MTFLRAMGDQLQKARLAHLLQLSLRDSPRNLQYFTGSTTLATVTNMLAALVFSQGQPQWLAKLSEDDAFLSDSTVLRCLFESSRLLFVKAVSEEPLSQAEQLVMTLAESWGTKMKADAEMSEQDMSLCALVEQINTQLHRLELDQRNSLRSMV